MSRSQLYDHSWPILLKKSVLAGAALPELKKCTIWALLRENQGSSVSRNRSHFNVDNALLWAEIVKGLFQQNRPDSEGLISTVAMHSHTSVCSAISKESSTSIPRYRMVLSSFV